MVKKDERLMKALGKGCFRKAMLSDSTTQCDKDGDHFTNFRESHLPRMNGHKIKISFKKIDTDGDTLTDWDELMIYGTFPDKSDSDSDGISDGLEVNETGTDPLNKDSDGDGISDGQELLNSGGCSGPLFDANGDTKKFGIPSSLTGNTGRGQTIYSVSCVTCHRTVEKGTDFTFSQLSSALKGQTGTPMRFNFSEQTVADLVAWLNRAKTDSSCPSGPSPLPTPTNGLPTPSPTATATPCPGGSSVNFDSQGNTTAFSIPAPLVGNVSAGQSQYSATCITCHIPSGGDKGTNRTFTELGVAFTTNVFMNGTLGGPVTLNDQQVANLAAYLNRNNFGGCTSTTPTPTATPSPASRGAAIFAAACVSCHTISATGRPREMDRHPSLSKIHEALRQGPDEMPQFHELTLGQSAPPYSQSEQDLWAYLQSLP